MANAIYTKDVLTATRKIQRAFDSWKNQDGPNTNWRGHLTKQVSEELDMTIRTACDATADAGGMEVEDNARGLMLCLDNVAYAHQRWLQHASMGLPTAPPGGSDEWHRVLAQLAERLKTPPLPLPPPIEQLQRQNVSPNQIAVIYGWKTDDGGSDTQKVFDEIKKPGTHFNAKTWVHPAEKAIRSEINAKWEKRQPRPKLFAVGIQDNQRRDNPQIPSLDELIELRAPIAQIMKLHGLTEEEVSDLARSAGVDLNAREDSPAAKQSRTSRKSQEKQTA